MYLGELLGKTMARILSNSSCLCMESWEFSSYHLIWVDMCCGYMCMCYQKNRNWTEEAEWIHWFLQVFTVLLRNYRLFGLCWCVHVCLSLCVYLSQSVCVCVCKCVLNCVFECVCVCVQVCIELCIWVCVCVCVYIALSVCVGVCVFEFVCVCVCVFICVCASVYWTVYLSLCVCWSERSAVESAMPSPHLCRFVY